MAEESSAAECPVFPHTPPHSLPNSLLPETGKQGKLDSKREVGKVHPLCSVSIQRFQKLPYLFGFVATENEQFMVIKSQHWASDVCQGMINQADGVSISTRCR